MYPAATAKAAGSISEGFCPISITKITEAKGVFVALARKAPIPMRIKASG